MKTHSKRPENFFVNDPNERKARVFASHLFNYYVIKSSKHLKNKTKDVQNIFESKKFENIKIVLSS